MILGSVERCGSLVVFQIDAHPLSQQLLYGWAVAVVRSRVQQSGAVHTPVISTGNSMSNSSTGNSMSNSIPIDHSLIDY